MRLLAPSWYLSNNLATVENLLREAVLKELAGGGQSVLLGSLLSTLLSYPDVPFNFEGVYHPDTGEEIVSPNYRLSGRVLYPKELQLIKYVRERVKAGRKVGVYATFTGKLGTLQRLQMLLEEQGFKTAVLNRTYWSGAGRMDRATGEGRHSGFAHVTHFSIYRAGPLGLSHRYSSIRPDTDYRSYVRLVGVIGASGKKSLRDRVLWLQRYDARACYQPNGS